MSDVNETGVVLPWEQKAIRGEEMPDGLSSPDQMLFLQLRMLYFQKRTGIIDRNTAVSEKRKLLDQYRVNRFHNDLEKQFVSIIKATELARSNYRKNRTLDAADEIISIIEGRKKLGEVTV